VPVLVVPVLCNITVGSFGFVVSTVVNSPIRQRQCQSAYRYICRGKGNQRELSGDLGRDSAKRLITQRARCDREDEPDSTCCWLQWQCQMYDVAAYHYYGTNVPPRAPRGARMPSISRLH